jgi:hypothetical protein
VFQQSVAPSSVRFGTSYGTDLSCIGLHCIFILWSLVLSSREHFVAAHVLSLGAI